MSLLALLGLALAAAPLIGALSGSVGGWAPLLLGIPVVALGAAGLGGARLVRPVGSAVAVTLGWLLVVVGTARLRGLRPPPGAPTPSVDAMALLTGGAFFAVALLLMLGRPRPLASGGVEGQRSSVASDWDGPDTTEPGHAPMTPRRALALLAVGLVLLALILADLNAAVRIDSYRRIDQRTIIVTVYVEALGWTRVTGVTETPSEVRIKVEDLAWPVLGPQAATLGLREFTIHLSADLGDRVVLDGLGNVVPLSEPGSG